MFSRPPYLPLLAGIWLTPVVISLIIWPLPLPWAWWAPAPYAQTLTLQYRSWFDADPRCFSAAGQMWREIVRSPHPASWFRALALEGTTPAARLYGLVGLQQVAPSGVQPTVAHFDGAVLQDQVQVWPGEVRDDPYIPRLYAFAALVHPDTLARFSKLLWSGGGEPEC